MRRALPYLVLAAAVAAVLAGRNRREPLPRRSDGGMAPLAVARPAHAARPRRPRESAEADTARAERRAARRRRLPSSLAGTAPDGQLAVDDAGRLVVSRETRRFFDYFLAAGAEDGAGRARARVVAEIRSRLPGGAVPEAIDLLDHYLAYRRRARGAEVAGDAAGRLDRLHVLREETLGPDVARAFFADEEAAETVAAERTRLIADPSLDPAERERRMAALEERLPEPVRRARAAALAPLHLAHEEAELRASGAPATEIRALRERSFGAEAADRLEELDRQRAAWQQRLDDYRAARDAIEHDGSLDAGARERAVETLQSERFTPEERLRVAALDRIRQAER